MAFRMKFDGSNQDFYKKDTNSNFPILNEIFSAEKSLFEWFSMVKTGTFQININPMNVIYSTSFILIK
jgi:hypothetical protein